MAEGRLIIILHRLNQKIAIKAILPFYYIFKTFSHYRMEWQFLESSWKFSSTIQVRFGAFTSDKIFLYWSIQNNIGYKLLFYVLASLFFTKTWNDRYQVIFYILMKIRQVTLHLSGARSLTVWHLKICIYCLYSLSSTNAGTTSALLAALSLPHCTTPQQKISNNNNMN